jgi:N-methylhydantoinase A/oxoprolinase/acetone carboxylase beta subunit
VGYHANRLCLCLEHRALLDMRFQKAIEASRARGLLTPMPKIACLTSRVAEHSRIAPVKHQVCVFRVDGKLQKLQVPFYRREQVAVDRRIVGPAVVLQLDTTTVIPPDCSMQVHPSGMLIVSVPTA